MMCKMVKAQLENSADEAGTIAGQGDITIAREGI